MLQQIRPRSAAGQEDEQFGYGGRGRSNSTPETVTQTTSPEAVQQSQDGTFGDGSTYSIESSPIGTRTAPTKPPPPTAFSDAPGTSAFWAAASPGLGISNPITAAPQSTPPPAPSPFSDVPGTSAFWSAASPGLGISNPITSAPRQAPRQAPRKEYGMQTNLVGEAPYSYANAAQEAENQGRNRFVVGSQTTWGGMPTMSGRPGFMAENDSQQAALNRMRGR